MNIYEIAEKANVSIATVSRVINNTGKVKQETKDRILQIIKDNNFIKKTEQKKFKAKTVALVCSNLKNPNTAKTVDLLTLKLSQINYKPLLILCDSDLPNKRKTIENLDALNLSAIFIEGNDFLPYDNEDSKTILKGVTTPTIILNGFVENFPSAYYILSNYESAINHLVNNYIKNDIKEILLLFDSMNNHAKKLLKSYEDTFFIQGLEIDSDYTKLCKDYNSTYDYIDILQKKNKMPKLIITSNDLLSLHCINVLKEKNIQIPDDINVIGLGNSFLCDIVNPKLSSFDIKTESICQTAIKTFLGIINHESVPSTGQIPVELISRGTTSQK